MTFLRWRKDGWARTWIDYDEKSQRVTTLTHGRQEVA